MNKKLHAILISSFLALLMLASDVEARGGGRGGGGGFGGGGRGGGGGFGGGGGGARPAPNLNRGMGVTNRNAIDRAPTMSRASSWSPNGARANGSMIAQRQPVSQQRSNPGATRSQLQQFLGQGNQKGALQGAAGTARPNFDQSSLSNLMQNQNRTGNQIRQGIDNAYPNRGNWFNQGGGLDHPVAAAAAARGLYNAATWGDLSSAWGWGNVSPYYYDNGYAYSAPYYPSSSGTSYYNQPTYNTNTQPQTTYTQPQTTYTQPQATTPTTEQVAMADTTNTLSLGVFALTTSQVPQTQPDMYMQLTVDKNGNISGTYYNQASNQSVPIEGLVDKSTQKAVWKMTEGENSPIFQTGIYNLTLAQTSVNVNFGTQSQNWFLVRVNAPAS